MQQSTECASGVSAATKAEDENLVAGVELPHQERINVGDVVGEAIAECESSRSCPPLSDRAQGTSRPHRSNAGVIVGGLLVFLGQRPIELYDVRVSGPVLIPGSVTTNDYLFRHSRSTSKLQDEFLITGSVLINLIPLVKAGTRGRHAASAPRT